MNLNRDDNKMVFAISVGDVQDVAVDMPKRRLMDYEMRTAEKCIESGRTLGLDIVFKAAIEDVIEGSK